MIQTQRLILRRWRDEDVTALTTIDADPEVAFWLGGLRFVGRAATAIQRYNAFIDDHGFGRFAVEIAEGGRLIGAAGVMPVFDNYPFAGLEIGWRLARDSWGQGYASEAAAAALPHAFEHTTADELFAFTAAVNQRSMAVMERIGMVRDPALDFDHEGLAEGDALRPHVVYVARRG